MAEIEKVAKIQHNTDSYDQRQDFNNPVCIIVKHSVQHSIDGKAN
jgi:hypothetical protein